MKPRDNLIYSAVGLAALLLALVAFNYLASGAAVRLDLTQGKLYTLSEGTRRILRALDAPVKLKLYISQGEHAMPVPLRSFAQRVEDLAREFKSVAGAYLAITCMTSAMTRNQVVAFILAVVLCLFLILAGFNPVTDLLVRWASPAVVDAVAAFSVVTHFDGFQKGVLDSRDLLFFLSVIGFALFATGVIIRGHRAG